MANTVRITSGKFRGRMIATPGGKTHPMGERERLALFNMISAYLPSSRVLDAFAGSGALGIEALSRDAKEVVFVDNSRDAINTIKANLRNLSLDDFVEVVKSEVSSFSSREKFGVILVDPPYDDFDVVKFAHLTNNLADDGALVLSHPGDAPTIEGLRVIKTRKYANATISVYIKG